MLSGDRDRIALAGQLAERRGFASSSEPAVGRLLAKLVSGLPSEATVVELGTGTGVGLAWIVSGLNGREDVKVISVDTDPQLIAEVTALGWPANVTCHVEDGLELLRRLPAESVHLLFADAPAGKLYGIASAITALAAHGCLVLDDMTRRPDSVSHAAAWPAIQDAEKEITADPRLYCQLQPTGSGVLTAVRRATGDF